MARGMGLHGLNVLKHSLKNLGNKKEFPKIGCTQRESCSAKRRAFCLLSTF